MASVSALYSGHGSRTAGAAPAWSPVRSGLTTDLKPMGKPPLADAGLDRRLQNAYRSTRRGEALRPRGATTPGAGGSSGRVRPQNTTLDKGRLPHPSTTKVMS